MASAFYLESTVSRRTALLSYYRSLESPPPVEPVAPATVDAAVYSVLVGSIEQLRPASFLRPPPTSWSEFETAVAARSTLEKPAEESVDTCKKEVADPMEISSALHSTLDDIQQILSAGPSSSQDHTHLDEQALGEITAFLQSGPPVIWPESDPTRLATIANILPISNISILQQSVSNAVPPISTVTSAADQQFRKPAEKSSFEWPTESSSSTTTHDSTTAVVCLKRYQCVLCLSAFDVAPSAQHHTASCGVCAGDVLEVPIYRCRRCGASYYSESAAHHHTLFLCTRDDAGDDIGQALRRYSCPVCQAAFFSSTSLQSHAVSVHGSLPSLGADMYSSAASELDGLSDNLSEIYPHQSDVIQAPAEIQSPFVLPSAAVSSPASADEASVPLKVSQSPEATAVGAGVTHQSKPRARRRYSGRPPKGIIYKNVFMTSEGLYYCSTCSADLNTVERRAEHRGRPCGRASAASYSRHYVFICPHCSSRWSSQKACYEHQITTCLVQLGINVADLSLRRYACPICSRLHFSLAPLRGHMTTAHRLHRDDVIQRLITAGYMTPEGTNVKFDDVVGVPNAGLVKPAVDNTCNSSSASSNISEAEIIALLNKELQAALDERGHEPVSTESVEEKSDFSPTKLSVLTAFPQLPKPVVNLRAIPKIMTTSSSSAVMPCNSNVQSNRPLTATEDTEASICDSVEVKQESIDSKNTTTGDSDLSCVSSTTAPVCSEVNDLSMSPKNDTSLQDLRHETTEVDAVLSPTHEVTSTVVSPKCHTTSKIATEPEKQSTGNSDGVPVRNGKLKFIFNNSDFGEQQIKLPVVALERTNLLEINPHGSRVAASDGAKLRPHQNASVHLSSADAHHNHESSTTRKSSRVSDNWKPSLPILRIPISHPRTRASRGFSYKRSLSRANRLVDQKLRNKRSLKSDDFVFDCFRGKHAVAKSRNSRRQFTVVSSGADTAAIATRSQCRQMLTHNAR